MSTTRLLVVPITNMSSLGESEAQDLVWADPIVDTHTLFGWHNYIWDSYVLPHLFNFVILPFCFRKKAEFTPMYHLDELTLQVQLKQTSFPMWICP